MSALPILAIQCNSCSNWVSPFEVVRIGESVIKCWTCYEKHRQIIESWETPPRECALCHITFDDLAKQRPGEPVSMFLHEIDGTFGFVCRTCDKDYVLKRRDLYGNTRFGWQRGVK